MWQWCNLEKVEQERMRKSTFPNGSRTCTGWTVATDCSSIPWTSPLPQNFSRSLLSRKLVGDADLSVSHPSVGLPSLQSPIYHRGMQPPVCCNLLSFSARPRKASGLWEREFINCWYSLIRLWVCCTANSNNRRKTGCPLTHAMQCNAMQYTFSIALKTLNNALQSSILWWNI